MDLFNQWIAPITNMGISIMKLIVALGVVAVAITGGQMLMDYITGNGMAMRQHRGQLVKIGLIVLIFGAGSLVVTTVNNIATAAGG